MVNELRGCRPFPFDIERKERCQEILSTYGMTMAELAMHLGVSKVLITNVINGRDLSPTNEQRIATFLNIPREYLFPERTPLEIAAMRKAEAEQKQKKEALKQERMELRKKALGVA